MRKLLHRIFDNTLATISLAFVVIAVPLAIALWLFIRTLPTADTVINPETGETELLPVYEEQREKLEKIIADWREAVPAETSVVISDIFADYSVFANEMALYAPDGLERLYIATAVYIQAQELGDEEFDEELPSGNTVGHCVEAMILASDDVCTEELGFFVGWELIDGIVKEIGLQNTRLNNYIFEGTTQVGDRQTGAEEVALFLNSLFESAILEEEKTAEILELLANHEQADRLPANADERGSITHVTGGVDDTFHDAGFVTVQDDRVYSYVITSSGWNAMDQQVFAPVYFQQLMDSLLTAFNEF